MQFQNYYYKFQIKIRISPISASLHWLPVKCRLDVKILLLTYKALNGLTPSYLQNLIVPYISKLSPTPTEITECRFTCSSQNSQKWTGRTILQLSSSITLQPVTNLGPRDQSLKIRLKTFLFSKAYKKKHSVKG